MNCFLATALSGFLAAPLVAQAEEPSPTPASAPDTVESADIEQNPVDEPREHPLAAEARELRELMDGFLSDKDNKFKTYESKKARLRLHSDRRSSREPKAALKATEEVLQAMLWGLGPYDASEEKSWRRDDHPIELYLIDEEELYFAIIDAIADHSPRYAGFLQSCKEGTGFTLYPARLSVYFHNVKIQAEARIDHSIAHNAAHLELHRRYGFTPLPLAEAVACAAEELALGEIWANWYRDGFVYATSHGGWRGNDTKKAVEKHDLDEFWHYPGKPYHDELAHLGYGWAIYAFESRPEAMHRLFRAIQERYDAHPEQGGLYKISPEDLSDMAREAFGPELQEELKAYWKKVPKAPKITKLRG